MDGASLIGPAVVAAVISAVVSGIGIWISTATTRSIHTEKLAFDREQAERRVNAEIALAKKKFALDQEFAAWKRRGEFAEEVLADFYQARDVINAARSPASFEGEGHTRPRGERETEDETRTFDAYYATTERLKAKGEFFSQLHARRYRFIAYFGTEAAKPYDDLHRIYIEVVVAVRMLIQTHRDADLGNLPQTRGQWEKVVWDLGSEDDNIRPRLDQIIQAIETVCGPVLREEMVPTD